MKTNFCQSQDIFVQHPTNLATQSRMPLLLPGVMQEHPSIENGSQERDSSESSTAFLEATPPKDSAEKAL
jgi:hypothetical protein